MQGARRHFTTSVYVVDANDASERRVLMLKHKKLGSWLPPGGHVHENELPDECALRELYEETGIRAVLDGAESTRTLGPNVRLLPSPHHLQLEEIEEGRHYHIDFIYFARLAGSAEIVDGESHGQIRWFTSGELEAIPEKEIFHEARMWAFEALEKVRQTVSAEGQE